MNTQLLKTTEGTLAFDDTGGHGNVVVCIPGMGDLRGQYRYLAADLVHAGHRVITLDIRGHGESSTGWSEYTAEAVTRDLFALLDHLKIQQASILGNSFAARSAIYAASQQPGRIQSIVLLCPVVRNLPMPWSMDLMLKVAFAGPWSTSFWMMYWNSLFTSRKPADHQAYTTKLRRNIRQKGQMDALKRYMQPSKTDAESLLGTLKTPALVVMGTKDPDFKDATLEAKTIAEKLHADLMLVDGAGHYPHTERPEEVSPRVLDFLKQVK